MKQILICEDNAIHLNIIKQLITEYLNQSEFDAQIICASNSYADILKQVQLAPSSDYIYFLDIDLNADINGIELASQIRTHDSEGKIIFITTHAELTPITFKYKVEAFDFIAKSTVPEMRTEIFACLAELEKRDKSNTANETFMTIKIGTITKKIFHKDILFFETAPVAHKIKLHTLQGLLTFYGKISEFEELNPDFLKCHASYVVNRKNIATIDKKNRMINNQTCPISFRSLKYF